MTKIPKEPSLIVSLIPVTFLILLLVLNIIFYKDDATGGANQIALLLAACLTVAIGVLLYKITYKAIEQQIIKSIGMALQACIILLSVGALIRVS